jgi:predicted nuclease of predicted toxin-antitoxin system
VPKLLLDNNLSHRLVHRIETLFPGSLHVSRAGLEYSSDWEVWNFARAKEFAILTKDSDFNDLTLLRGAPPKIIWLRTGNCRVAEIEKLLFHHAETILDFLNESTSTILELYE